MIRLLVLVYQSLVLALAQIWSNKVRSALTAVGIVIGVASVTAVIAALTGLRATVMKEFEGFGTNKVFVFPSRPQTGPKRDASYTLIRFRPELFDDLLPNAPSLSTFTRVTSTNTTVRYEDRSVPNINVAGIESSWHQIENRQVTLGRPFSLIDNEQARPVCLINSKLQDALGLPRDPTGTAVFLGGRRYTVIGLVEPGIATSVLSDGISDSEVFVPFPTAYRANKALNPLPFMYVIATAKSPALSEEAQQEIVFYLRKARKIAPGEEDTFRVEFIDRFVQQFNNLAAGITVIAGGVVGISLLVGGIGIMNIMFVSVSERTREIGLRKAIGARPGAILLQFLIEAVTLCFAGGLIGVAVGQGITWALASIPGTRLDQAYVPLWAVLLSFGFSAGVGLIFGMLPAVKAARLDPIEALRHE